MAAYYIFLSSRRPEYLGHNPIAGLSYFLLYLLVFLEGITGLALYAEYFPGGLMYTLFGWVWALGANNNIVRMVHHLLMWVFLAFFLLHLYLAVLNDLIEGSGVNSSIITGYKN
jgi:Ni/Fe-hydrogenase 1 B-type cytochrome subunit